MRSIRTLVIAGFLLIFANMAMAGESVSMPTPSFLSFFKASLKKIDGLINVSAKSGRTGAKICSCQILQLSSNNADHRTVAVFAEKTNYGNYSADFGDAKNAIEKEKKHLRQFFFDKVKKVDELSEATDCHSLYIKLKIANGSLVMYDVLNADIR
jgi:hypothetical protein